MLENPDPLDVSKTQTHITGAVVRLNKAETAVQGCHGHCPGDMAVRMLKVLPGQTVGWCSSVSLAFIVFSLNLAFNIVFLSP